MGGADQYFSVIALFILFRETIEASIIVSVLLQFLSRSFPSLRKQVWWGVGAGLIVSIIFGVVFSCVYYVAKNNVFNGNDKAIFKGSIAWFAGCLIAILAFAMLRYKGWEDKIKRKLETLAQKELDKRNGVVDAECQAPPPTTWHGKLKYRTTNCLKATWQPIGHAFGRCWTATSQPVGRACGACWDKTTACSSATGRALTGGRCCKVQAEPAQAEIKDGDLVVTSKHGWGIFLLVFSTVCREGIESVVFLAGVGNAQPSSLPIPGVVGFICGIAAGVFCYYTGKQVKDLKWFMIIMSIILFFVAGGQFMIGADYLMTGGMFGYRSPFIVKQPWTMQPLWDWSKCCSDQDTGDKGQYKFFALARAIFGYQDQPSFIELMVYAVYWLFVVLVGIYKWRTGSLFDADYKHNREMRKKAKEEAEQRAEMEAALGVQLSEAAELDAKKLALTHGESKEVALAADSDTSESGLGPAAIEPECDSPVKQTEAAPTQNPAQQEMKH